VPQFILDSLILSGCGSTASIIVTQPRRISAISVAARVSSERCEDGSVGYAIRGESKQDKLTKLLFCTTGVILRRLSSGDRLQDVTHVIVDEVICCVLLLTKCLTKPLYLRFTSDLWMAIFCY
jgi:HrpA-like RNA helicase